MTDLESKGCFFTWSNTRKRGCNIQQGLDRAICNIDWRLLFPNSQVFSYLSLGFNHFPIMILFKPKEAKGKKNTF